MRGGMRKCAQRAAHSDPRAVGWMVHRHFWTRCGADECDRCASVRRTRCIHSPGLTISAASTRGVRSRHIVSRRCVSTVETISTLLPSLAIVCSLLQQAGTVAIVGASCRAMRLKRCVPLSASARKRSARSSRTSTAAHPFALASRSSLPPAPSPLHRELSFSFFRLHLMVSEHARMRTRAEA